MTIRTRTCFVIMPFGEKPDVGGGTVIDFDVVYETLIKNTIEELGLTCIRCDEISRPGLIHSDMFTHIFDDDVAVVDITTLNANVFYELGVRHALSRSVTVLIRKKGSALPFNISGLRVIDYDYENLAGDGESRSSLRTFVQQGLEHWETDSPVHSALGRLRVAGSEKRLPDGDIYRYRVPGTGDATIAIVTGDIRRIKGIDIWVNPENTNMQMARFYDRSISSNIRYLGSRRNQLGHVVEDVIANELAALMGNTETVPANTVIATGAGELTRTHGVKRILHAAAVFGELGHGYTQVANIGDCVTNALDLASTLRSSEAPLNSILFQMMGSGAGRGAIQASAKSLIDAAVAYLKANPASPVSQVYFNVTREGTLEVCQCLLREAGGIPAA